MVEDDTVRCSDENFKRIAKLRLHRASARILDLSSVISDKIINK